MAEVYVRFECGQENRVSKEYGPFAFVQMTYDILRIGPNGDDFAYLHDHDSDGMWHLAGQDEPWSDVIIFSKYTPLHV